MAEPEPLETLVHRVDVDRWLAARFIGDGQARAAVTAVYALNYELAHVGESVRQPMVGEIRLAWWREGLQGLFEGGEAPAHPVMQALAGPAHAQALARPLLEQLVESRHADLEPTPFADEPALIAYLDGTAGAVMALATRLLDRAASPEMTLNAARAWGWAGLLRARPFWESRGRRWLPASWGEADDAEVASHVRHRVQEALAAARGEAARLPVAAFPALAYATLAGPYSRRPELSALSKQARLTWAVARGRI